MSGCSRWSWTGYASGRPSRRRRAGRLLVVLVVVAKTDQNTGLFDRELCSAPRNTSSRSAQADWDRNCTSLFSGSVDDVDPAPLQLSDRWVVRPGIGDYRHDFGQTDHTVRGHGAEFLGARKDIRYRLLGRQGCVPWLLRQGPLSSGLLLGVYLPRPESRCRRRSCWRPLPWRPRKRLRPA